MPDKKQTPPQDGGHGKGIEAASHEKNRTSKGGKDMPKARKGTMGRVVKLLMEDYK